MKNDSAAVLFSGGQDSTAYLFWVKKHFNKVYVLSFLYEQRHAHEVELAWGMAERAGAEFHVMGTSFIESLGSSSLVDVSISMDEDKPEDSFPNTFVPGRNLFFLSIAAALACKQEAFHLVAGVSQTDYNGYSDCHGSFIRSLDVTLNLATDERFVIHTPLMWIDRAETWALTDKLGVSDLVRNETLTCYSGIPADGCKHRPVCKLRKQGLEEYLSKRNR